MFRGSLIPIIPFMLFIGCTTTVQDTGQWHSQRDDDVLPGARIGVTRLSEYPPQAAAPEGIRATDGRILQCYKGFAGSPSRMEEIKLERGYQGLIFPTTARFAFFDSTGTLTAPPAPHPVVHGLYWFLQELRVLRIVGDKGKELRAQVLRSGAAEIQFSSTQARLLLLSLMGPCALGCPEELSVEAASIYVSPDHVDILFTGGVPILLVGRRPGFYILDRCQTEGAVAIDSVGKGVKVSIFSRKGTLVTEWVTTDTGCVWRGDDRKHRPVKPGGYFYRVTRIDGSVEQGTIVVRD
jgi:hypothetical protein